MGRQGLGPARQHALLAAAEPFIERVEWSGAIRDHFRDEYPQALAAAELDSASQLAAGEVQWALTRQILSDQPSSSSPNQMNRNLLRGCTLRIIWAISRMVAEPELVATCSRLAGTSQQGPAPPISCPFSVATTRTWPGPVACTRSQPAGVVSAHALPAVTCHSALPRILTTVLPPRENRSVNADWSKSVSLAGRSTSG